MRQWIKKYVLWEDEKQALLKELDAIEKQSHEVLVKFEEALERSPMEAWILMKEEQPWVGCLNQIKRRKEEWFKSSVGALILCFGIMMMGAGSLGNEVWHNVLQLIGLVGGIVIGVVACAIGDEDLGWWHGKRNQVVKRYHQVSRVSDDWIEKSIRPWDPPSLQAEVSLLKTVTEHPELSSVLEQWRPVREELGYWPKGAYAAVMKVHSTQEKVKLALEKEALEQGLGEKVEGPQKGMSSVKKMILTVESP